MSGFDLVPVDGGDTIHLPPGESVLGRGPLLGVSDKRVSRHHGLLENLNGQLRLKPTHLNPCFVQSALSDEPRPLHKDSWYPLHHGDLFSLLPGQFIFKVEAVGGEDRTPRNSQVFDDDNKLPVSPKPDVDADVGQDRGPSPPTSEKKADSPNTSLNKGNTAQPEEEEEEDGHSDVPPPVARKRVLPAWMMTAAGTAKNPSPSLKVRRRQTPAAAPTSSKRAAARQAPELSEEGEEEEEEEEARPRKKRRKTSDEEPAQSTADVPSVRSQSGPSRSEVSDESDNCTMEVEEEGNTTTRTSDISKSEKENKNSKPGPQTTKPEPAESSGYNSGSAPAPSKPRVRTPCPYGKDCYRKNPIHFQECSHPGDTDYEEEDEEMDEADRPECPYGTDCYRKNPLHRKEYRHTEKPARSTRTVPTNVAADEDEDEYDNSFINDDSEDVGDDSDYVPPDSDDGDKEDVRRLQREAKEFLKRRK